MEPYSRPDLLEREKRLTKPAGYATLAGVVLFILSAVITSGAGQRPDNDQEQLLRFHEHGGTLLLGSVLASLAFLLFTLPLYLLFIGAQARSPRVRGALVAFAFIGPVLLAIQGPVQAVALQDVGDKFAKELPALEAAQQSSDAAAAASDGDQPGSAKQGSEQKASGAAGSSAKPSEQKGGEVTTTPTEQATSSTTTTADSSSDDESTAAENRAEDLTNDSSAAQFARALIYPAVLGLLIGLVYISLWAMRVGLLTRFTGSLGMAIGASLLLLGPLAQLLMIVWFLLVGMVILGFSPRGRPPAWDAGVAIPWLKPSEQAARDAAEAVEGEGRDVTDHPEGGSPEANGGDRSQLPPGLPPRKRKRRR